MILRLSPTTDTFTTPQVAKIIGVTQRKLLSFLERGYVTPSVQDAAGHGSKRLWNYDDLIRCAVIRFLQNQTAETLREVGRQIADDSRLTPRCGLCILPPDDGKSDATVKHVRPIAKDQDVYKVLTDLRLEWPAITVVHFGDVRKWIEGRFSTV
jgi:DNA-binding transcriptional MerR regulator